ncbi:hypothetical protein AVEN_44551-1 [Araneus ventricosus]|uniref:Uncharacterized protein n=1 Tax=Araneus ventricosus TaxID=182803 RepID=A0A4Y2LG93_ARAVE|nr:hypothetical protein AVEN_44551-1 [Araneus ventricosus]
MDSRTLFNSTDVSRTWATALTNLTTKSMSDFCGCNVYHGLHVSPQENIHSGVVERGRHATGPSLPLRKAPVSHNMRWNCPILDDFTYVCLESAFFTYVLRLIHFQPWRHKRNAYRPILSY